MERRKELLFRLLWWAAATGVGWLALRYALVWLLRSCWLWARRRCWSR